MFLFNCNENNTVSYIIHKSPVASNQYWPKMIKLLAKGNNLKRFTTKHIIVVPTNKGANSYKL